MFYYSDLYILNALSLPQRGNQLEAVKAHRDTIYM